VQGGDGCWLWTGSTGRGGYGQLSYAGKYQRAHRVAWILTFGEIPPGMFVLHRCDVPPCCRPDHLFLGTQRDNIHDMLQKGHHITPARTWRGPTHPRWLGGYRAWVRRHNRRRREATQQRALRLMDFWQWMDARP